MEESGAAHVPEDAYAAALENQCDALIQQRTLERALDACRKVVRLHPDRATAHYNLAGALALAGRMEEALRELEEDSRLGDRDWEYLTADAWFESLRRRPEFRSLIDRMKASP